MAADRDAAKGYDWLRIAAILISPLTLLIYVLAFLPALAWQAARVDLFVAFGWRLPPEGDPMELLHDE